MQPFMAGQFALAYERFMKSTLLSVLAITVCAAPAVAATTSQPTSVVELFTSQGCSSCPTANAFIADLNADHPDVLALSYGVTYWDYLGWKDTFGDPAFTARQRQYDQALDSGVYTPMMVVGGQAHAPRMPIDTATRANVPASIALVRQSGELCVEGKLPKGSKLALIGYEPGIQAVNVKKGENRGHTLTLANVVTDLDYREWSGQMVCGLHPKAGLAVLAHDATTAAIIGAARFEP